jgi:nucleotide-binding universal stress UspA family protein
MPVVKQGILTKILVAVGGSESSFSALHHAVDLASAAKTNPTALIVEEVPVTPELIFACGEEMIRLSDRLAASVQRIADGTERKVCEIAGRRQIQIDIERQTGRVRNRVIAAGVDASLLVLGRQGHHTDRVGLLGSNTELIARRSHKPMLIAPRAYRRVNHVLVAYGGKDLGGLALDTGLEIAETLCLPLDVLSVAGNRDVAEAIQQLARTFWSDKHQRATFVVDTGDPATAILAHCAPSTLIVMGAYGHSRLYHMMLGSVTEQVVRFARGPVILSAKQPTPTSE